jgi:hypothetical protein
MVSRPSADYFVVGRRQKVATIHASSRVYQGSIISHHSAI